jgi:hypothetical protein
LGQVCIGGINSGCGLTECQRSRHSCIEAALGQVVRFLLTLQSLASDFENGLVGEHCQVGAHYLGDQAELRAAAALLGAQVLFKGFVVQTADPAEQVDLVGSESHAGFEEADGPAPGAGNSAGITAARGPGCCGDA